MGEQIVQLGVIASGGVEGVAHEHAAGEVGRRRIRQLAFVSAGPCEQLRNRLWRRGHLGAIVLHHKLRRAPGRFVVLDWVAEVVGDRRTLPVDEFVARQQIGPVAEQRLAFFHGAKILAVDPNQVD